MYFLEPVECPPDDAKLPPTESIESENIIHETSAKEVTVAHQVVAHQLETPETSVTPNFEYFLPPQAVVPMVQVNNFLL